MRYLPVSWTSALVQNLADHGSQAEKNNDPDQAFLHERGTTCGARSIDDQRALLLAYGRQAGYAEYRFAENEPPGANRGYR